MPNRNLDDKTAVAHLGNLTLSGTTPAASDWFDTRDYDAVLLILVNNTVTDAGTASGYSFEVQEGDTAAGSGASAVADAELSALESTLSVTSDSADDAIAGIISYVGNSRYVRVNATGTTNTDADVSVIAIGMRASVAPDLAGVVDAVEAT